jgi:transcriptional regulator GlxA family with amidase domain
VRTAFIIYDGMTTLDFIGAYDALTRLKTMGFREDFAWDVCAATSVVADGTGLRILPTRVGGSLAEFDLVIVPGGGSARRLVDDSSFIAWLRTASACPLKVSVCSGALLLGAAGFLEGRRATTHRTAQTDLARYCATVLDERIVDDGDLITARGVTSSIDLGLYLVERIAGREVRDKIQRQMDYEGARVEPSFPPVDTPPR